MATIDAAQAGISLTVTNEATGTPVLYLHTRATLQLRLVNDTGADLPLSATTPAALTIFLPRFFTPADAGSAGLDLSRSPGWTAAPADDTGAILLSRTGGDGTWAAGAALTFSLGNVQSSAQSSDSDSLQVNPSGIPGAPLQVSAAVSIIAAPAPGNAKLRDVLQISLDHQGVVYVSQPADPLANTLFLNVKNVGVAPLSTGTTAAGNPQIQVGFTYGSTVGALAPADTTATPLGSAWNIVGGVMDSSGNPWTVGNPSITGGDTTPQWTLTPDSTNTQLIGVGEQANVTFSFSAIVSFLLPGHTQMTVRFSGFQKDATTAYDEDVFVLDIVKQSAPATRGLLGLFSVTPLVHVTSPADQVSIGLRWSMAQVAKVSVINSVATTSPVTDRSYASPPPALAYDQLDIPMTGFAHTTPVFLTLQAFDGMGAYLNSVQFTTLVLADEFVDPVDGRTYPTVRIGNQQWMAANLDRGGAGTVHTEGSEQQFGLLYPAASAVLAGNSDGWRLPHRSDWDALLAMFGTPTAAYAALSPSGSTGFNAALAGYRDNSGAFAGLGQAAYYWTDTPGTRGGQQYANLSSVSTKLNLGFEFPPDFAASVRYVRDL